MKGSSKAIWQFYCVVLLLASAFAPSTSYWIRRGLTKDYVRIVNNLNNQQLQYQCKSKDDDFGLRSLPPNGEYEWGFRVNLWGSTLYFCNFWYLDNHAVFDVFRDTIDFLYECGGAHCIWKAKEDGIYLFHIQTKEDKKMHDWEKIKA
ncbi:unnamed protein product [Prunus armeniaca]|uniref:S-protein homolog n=2 Tax=Prunus TaxID=3754 RepID=A0A6J5X3E0_PRUAR|nr:PREDICTED: uncharacterized protein LOC103326668 [Prunus mume]KAH0987376.1 hypothetical protein GBA52_014553 [Prunus armeniaca]CAB4278131.1 unnamed protein product [Prunus armeniaca]CAB4308546.1 unnamed protein product [Prunus armeniaca]